MKELEIEGMTCAHCVSAVERAIGSVPGARLTEVKIGSARVDADQTALESIRQAVEKEGYHVTDIR